MTNLFLRRAVLAALAMTLAPVGAQAGFLDQLFGGNGYTPAPLQQPNSGFSYDNVDPNLGMAPLQRAPRKKKVAAVEKTPNLQKVTDLMSDKTLQPGDAIMMKSGLHIYDGPKASHHEADEFVALDKADVSKKARGALTALDMAHRAPANFIASNAVQEGRSSSGQVVSQGVKIVDARGRSLRYVGP